MASRHLSNSSNSTGSQKLATYRGSSRKRPTTEASARDRDPDSSKTKLSQLYDYPSSPESSQPSSGPQESLPKISRKIPPSISSKPKPTAAVINRTPTNNGLGRKRDHAAAFATDRSQSALQGQKIKRDEESAPTQSKTVPNTHPQGHATVQRKIPNHQHDESQSSSSRGIGVVQSTDSTPTSAAVSGRANTNSSRRPRLIDALAAQKATLSSYDDDREPDLFPGSEQTLDIRRDLQSQEADQGIRTPDRRGTTTPANRKVRFTYSQSRRMISESQTPDVFDSPSRGVEDELDPLLTETQAISSPPPDAFALDESDDEDNAQPAIKSVHELRRAGANNRFADEMDDLIARIGIPGMASATMRRNALCELVQKLQRKDFLRQFRDHASRDTIARDIGKEDDVICGFALASALLSFLASGPAPNLLRQLASDGVGKLLALLLREDEDIAIIASHKKMNMSRTSRTSVEGVKAILQSLPIWHGYQPVGMSPRTVALQLMALLSRCADAAFLDKILSHAQRDIISVATWASEQGSHSDVDYALTIFTLETQSSAGVAPRLNSDGSHPVRIARLLSRALEHWPSGRPELDSAILKLAINTTNTETEAAAFDDAQLSTTLARRIGDLFVKVHGAITAGKLDSEIYDELLLMLGVMINIMEYCSPARRAVAEDAMDSLMKLWQDNQESVGEVSFSCHLYVAHTLLY